MEVDYAPYRDNLYDFRDGLNIMNELAAKPFLFTVIRALSSRCLFNILQYEYN